MPATTLSQARNARFQRGSGVYRCRCCGHNTRSTGGDGASAQLCDLCFDLSGEENHLSDSGKLYQGQENVRAQLAALDARNGAGAARENFPAVCDAANYA